MPRYAANMTWLFKDRPLMERFQAAKGAGFDGVEVLFPYDVKAGDMRRTLDIYELDLVLINCPPPNYTGGPQGFAAEPANKDRFKRDFARAMRYVEVLKPQFLHIMAGTAGGEEAEACFTENLAWATAQAPEQAFTIEPISPKAMPGYFLNDYDQAARILDTVNAPNLGLQLDTYHVAAITGDLTATWEAHGARVSHIQVGGHPNRNEPKGGDVDHPAFFEMLDQVGYKGWVSGEYEPVGMTELALDWRV